MNIENLHKLFLGSNGITTDSRKVNNGELYVALKGERFDGNKYANESLKKGASYAIVSEVFEPHNQLILVEDTLQTLQELANYHRKQFQIPVIAITGSNGKTTTKEILHAILSQQFNICTTKGNLNNHIGVPLTILNWAPDIDMALVEMGANFVGDIAGLCKIAQPNFGAITNIGKAHLEGFGGELGVIKGKTELYDSLQENAGICFVNVNDNILWAEVQNRSFEETINYNSNELKILSTKSALVNFTYKGVEVKTHLTGDYNLLNISLAIAIAEYFSVPKEKIIKAIENYVPTNNRSQLVNWQNNKVILDAYNANPDSMALAITNLNNNHQGEKVLVLGDMLELGKYSEQQHKHILGLLKDFNNQNILLVGNEFQKVKNNQYTFVKDNVEAKAWLASKSYMNATILIKGSRGIALEKIIDN